VGLVMKNKVHKAIGINEKQSFMNTISDKVFGKRLTVNLQSYFYWTVEQMYELLIYQYLLESEKTIGYKREIYVMTNGKNTYIDGCMLTQLGMSIKAVKSMSEKTNGMCYKSNFKGMYRTLFNDKENCDEFIDLYKAYLNKKLRKKYILLQGV
jgi:hypothetical protein